MSVPICLGFDAADIDRYESPEALGKGVRHCLRASYLFAVLTSYLLVCHPYFMSVCLSACLLSPLSLAPLVSSWLSWVTSLLLLNFFLSLALLLVFSPLFSLYGP